MGRKIDGLNDLTFTYDRAERMTLVRETGGGFPGCSATVVAAGVPRCLKELVYSGANAGANFSRGKLAEARRYNYPVIGTSQFVVIVNDLYTYGGREGRPSQKETRLTFQGTTTEYFSQSYVYDELGNITSLTYPNCAFAACASSPRNLSFGYSQGRLTSIPGVINSITYHQTGMVNSIIRANGVTDNWIADPNGMARPAEINAFTANWGPKPFGLWTTGSFQYDGSGNVKRMGNASFLYDSLSRVTSGTVYPGSYSNGTAHTQSYTFDIYGNITSVSTNNGTTGILIGIPTSSATNRLTGAVAYDNAGNLTSWNGATYEYDAFNQTKRFRSGSEEWLYMYDASDERFWEFKVGANPRYDRFTVRGLDGKPLRAYANPGYTWGNFEDYVYRDGMIAATLASDGTVLHQHPDHLGTPRLLSDATGRADRVQFHSYYPFGEELEGSYTATYANRMRLTGHERDLANLAGQGDDLDYMHARHYSPLLGRFLSTDRVGGRSWMPQSWNLYMYGLANPMKYTDPYGLCVVNGEEIHCDGGSIDVVTSPFGDRATGIGGSVADDPLRGLPSILDRMEAIRRGAIEAVKANLPPCKNISYGATVEISTINPFTSTGGGAYSFFNLQYVPGHGVGIYTYSTPKNAQSIGFSLGASLTGNAALGNGGWTGDFIQTSGSLTLLTFGGFGSPSTGLGPDPSEIGWHGLQFGVGKGMPGVGTTLTNYKQRADLSFLHPWCR